MKKKAVLYIGFSIIIIGVVFLYTISYKDNDEKYIDEEISNENSLDSEISTNKNVQDISSQEEESRQSTSERIEEKIYSKFSDFVNDYSEDILEHLSQETNSTISFNMLEPGDNPNYDNFEEIMEDVAINLGADEKDGSLFYGHAKNQVGGDCAYFSRTFFVNDIEYWVHVNCYDNKNYWTVGISKYEN